MISSDVKEKVGESLSGVSGVIDELISEIENVEARFKGNKAVDKITRIKVLLIEANHSIDIFAEDELN